MKFTIKLTVDLARRQWRFQKRRQRPIRLILRVKTLLPKLRSRSSHQVCLLVLEAGSVTMKTGMTWSCWIRQIWKAHQVTRATIKNISERFGCGYFVTVDSFGASAEWYRVNEIKKTLTFSNWRNIPFRFTTMIAPRAALGTDSNKGPIQNNINNINIDEKAPVS